jgi:ubiquilin
MGPPASAEDMLRQLDNPNFVQQMNEVMNSPMFLEMLENTPMFRDNPLARQMMRDPNIRRMMLDPNVIRAQLQMQQQMGGGGPGGSSFPAPGVTDTTPQTGGASETETGDQNQNQTQNTANQPPFMFPGMGLPTGGLGAGNPFAALFQPPPAATGTTQSPSETVTTSGTSDTTRAPTAGANPQQNPFGNLFGPGFAEYLAAAQGAGGQAGAAGNPTDQNNLFNNPALLSSLLGGLGAQNPQTPPDTRPPEERYADQLRQLNDMGFYEFERNIEALRRSGGSVQGAVEYLLTLPGGS